MIPVVATSDLHKESCAVEINVSKKYPYIFAEGKKCGIKKTCLLSSSIILQSRTRENRVYSQTTNILSHWGEGKVIFGMTLKIENYVFYF